MLQRCRDQGAYTDCYVTTVAGVVSAPAFIEAFYTTTLFKLERLILRWAVGKTSTDRDAQALASGDCDHFAAWRVEARASGQLLLADFTGRTKSWLMVETVGAAADANKSASGTSDLRNADSLDVSPIKTLLYFGSAVVPRGGNESDRRRGMGLLFHALLGFHQLYSRCLLRSARSRLLAQAARPSR
ncbi:hypothetical protein HPT27_08805 [Permianibacter sp. IMCC34836]|nr:hypothetical protein [Permianibacter fluminis]